MGAKRKHRATGKPRGGARRVGRNGRKPQYRVAPEVEEFRKHWRQRLTDPEWLARIERLAKTSGPLLIEIIRQGFGAPPAKIEHTGDPTVRLQFTLPGGGVLPAGATGLPTAGTHERSEG